ncbi:MAG: carboxypeptidase-like regulatory domain-containing protein, partial [Bryobacteraceae bacterium]
MRTLAAGLARVLLAITAWAQAPELRHEGVVRSGGQPVPGAVVTATQGDRKVITVTGEDGRYMLTGLTPGAWTLEVELTGFQKAQRTVELPATATLEWNLEILPRNAKAQPARRSAGF